MQFAVALANQQQEHEYREAAWKDLEKQDAGTVKIFDSEFSDFFSRHFKMSQGGDQVEINEMFFKENFQQKDLEAMKEFAKNRKLSHDELKVLSKELIRSQQVFFQLI